MGASSLVVGKKTTWTTATVRITASRIASSRQRRRLTTSPTSAHASSTERTDKCSHSQLRGRGCAPTMRTRESSRTADVSSDFASTGSNPGQNR